MAQQLVTLIWCDLQHAQETKGQPWTIQIAGPGESPTTYAIDLCDTCAKSFLDLRAEVVEHGRQLASKSTGRREPVAGSPSVHAPQPCPAPDCDFVTTAASGLDGHTRKVHGATIAELSGAATLPCAVDGCDRKFERRQGLIMHLRSHHGWTADQWRAV